MQGSNIIIFSARCHVGINGVDGATKLRNEMITWLNENGMKIGTHWHEVTSEKPPAIAYIDDRAIRFTNWEDVRKYFV